jgi:23S rRNA (cytosine1962-C5)-methyltransferase
MPPFPETFARALARRAAVRTPSTDCLRLVDSVGDKFSDLIVDDFAGRWLAQTRGGAGLPPWLAKAGLARSLYWKRLDQTEKQPPSFVAGEVIAEPFVVTENGLRFVIDFAAGYSQGLFLDQRLNRRRVGELARAGGEVLNLFAYTCGFSVCAAAGGAHAVSVDLSRPALDWGRRNFEANGLDPAQHEFIAGEAADWLRRFGKKGRKFDAIVLDPPTFSRDKKGKVFRVERDFGTLSGRALPLLRAGGVLLCTTNQRSLSRAAFASLILSGAEDPKAWDLSFAPMPPDFTGEPYLKTCWVTHR